MINLLAILIKCINVDCSFELGFSSRTAKQMNDLLQHQLLIAENLVLFVISGNFTVKLY